MIIYDGLKRAKEIAKKAKKKYEDRPDVVVEIISRTKGFAPPRGSKGRYGEWWCPYCGKYRRFYNDTELGVRRCPVCGISETAFYVDYYNGLRAKEYIKAKKSGKL